jgi:hypothetical protein
MTRHQIIGGGSRTEMDSYMLRGLQLIKTAGDDQPFRIVPLFPPQGAVMTPEEVMTVRIKWAEKAGYQVLTNDVPREFAPYNAVIRVSAAGTEDRNRDYLAHIAEDA